MPKLMLICACHVDVRNEEGAFVLLANSTKWSEMFENEAETLKAA